MILRGKYSGLVSSINPDTEYGVTAEDARIRESDDVPFLDCTDTTARYIEKLPEIVELLKELSESRVEGFEDTLENVAHEIITYAEGNDD